MRRSVLVYGGVMLAIGIVGWLATGLEHWTALIPAILGGLAIALTLLSGGAPVVHRLGALAIAAIALVGTASALTLLPSALAGGDAVANPAAIYARAATAIASLLLIAAVAAAWWRSRAAG